MYNLYADAEFGVGGVSKPLKTASVDTDEQISNRKVGGLVNILNNHTIQFYSFEPPTALHFLWRYFFSFAGGRMRIVLFFVLLVVLPGAVRADIASTTYVDNTKVDVSASANQTMAGTYTVSGTLIVPTPPLPSAL